MISIKETELPHNWAKKRLRDVCDINPEGINVSEYEKKHIIYIDISSINNQTNLIEVKTEIPLDEIPSRARRIVRKNDIIISTVRPYLKAFTKIKDQDEGNICSTGFAVLRSKQGLHYDYLYQWVFGDKFMRFMISNMVGSNYPAVNISDVEVAPIIVPPYQEQVKIANFLSNVDHLIQITHRLTDKLQECKKGLMQRLFTQGIGHTEFKDTELGRIPKEWKIEKLSELVKLNPQYTVPEKQDYAYLPMDAIDKEKMSPNYWERRTKESLTTTKFKNGDILFAKITPSTEHGKGALIKNLNEEIGFGSTELVVLSPKEGIFSDYLFYYTKRGPFRNRAVSLMEGATGRQRVPNFFFKTQLVAVPKDEEQRQIARILSNIDNQITNHQYYNNILKKIRKGLMQVLLTGKKRVPV